MVVIGILIGIVIITQIINLVGLGSAVLTGKILIWVVVRELGPLLAAIIIIARSVTAISAELGAMNVENEIENIEMMGIDPSRYLIMPRVFALTLSAVMLTFYFELAAIFGGITVTSIFWAVPFGTICKRDALFSEHYGIVSFAHKKPAIRHGNRCCKLLPGA